MPSSPVTIDKEHLRYLDFAENQHLQALSILCQQTDDPKIKAQLLAHRGKVGELIRRRKRTFQSENGLIIATGQP